MGQMNEAFTELAGLREVTRVRLAPDALQAVRDHVEAYSFMAEAYSFMAEDGDAADKLLANGLAVLLAMYDAIEATDGRN